MEEKTIQDIERLGLSTASLLLLININHIDGIKLRELWVTHDSAFNESFDSDSSKQIQLQSLINQHNSDVKLRPMKNAVREPLTSY